MKRATDRLSRGFTLIEILVALAILAILASVAIPSYQVYILKGHRSTAKAVLMETAQFMERYYTANNSYVGASVLTTVVPKQASASAVRYDVSFLADPIANAFTVRAVPTGAQSDDACGTLSISHTGAQAPKTAGCW